VRYFSLEGRSVTRCSCVRGYCVRLLLLVTALAPHKKRQATCPQTLYLLLQSLDLGIRIVNELVHMLIESGVFFGERLSKVVLVDAADHQ
jgi:hypothetical protein